MICPALDEIKLESAILTSLPFESVSLAVANCSSVIAVVVLKLIVV